MEQLISFEVYPKPPPTFLKSLAVVVIAAAFYAITVLFHESIEPVICGFGIILFALLPVYIWCKGRVGGLPIFPLFSLSFTWSYGLPFLAYPEVYSGYPELIWRTGLAICGFLLLATGLWYAVARKPRAKLPRVFLLDGKRADPVLFTCLGAALVITAVFNAGLLNLGEAAHVIRAILSALGTLALFILGFRVGSKAVPNPLCILYWAMMVAYAISSSVTIFMINGLTILFIAFMGLTLGKKRVSVVFLVVVGVVASVLHSGKSRMREVYWDNEVSGNLTSIGKYPAFYAEWFMYGLENIFRKESDEEGTTIMERASTLRLFLLAQYESPERLPFLNGETYWILPQTLVPRFLNSEKITAHEGTTLLNVHYGLQDREATERTTIGWGLFNESYANFGYFGIAGLAILIGTWYGWITRWSATAPILSYQNIIALLVLSLAVQSEFSASVYVSALFQGIVAVSAFCLLVMRRQSTGEQGARRKEQGVQRPGISGQKPEVRIQ